MSASSATGISGYMGAAADPCPDLDEDDGFDKDISDAIK
jgi:hypothetical protein